MKLLQENHLVVSLNCSPNASGIQSSGLIEISRNIYRVSLRVQWVTVDSLHSSGHLCIALRAVSLLVPDARVARCCTCSGGIPVSTSVVTIAIRVQPKQDRMMRDLNFLLSRSLYFFLSIASVQTGAANRIAERLTMSCPIIRKNLHVIINVLLSKIDHKLNSWFEIIFYTFPGCSGLVQERTNICMLALPTILWAKNNK